MEDCSDDKGISEGYVTVSQYAKLCTIVSGYIKLIYSSEICWWCCCNSKRINIRLCKWMCIFFIIYVAGRLQFILLCLSVWSGKSTVYIALAKKKNQNDLLF